MNRALAMFATLAILVLLSSTALSASRTWKSANGRFTIEADLVDFQDGKARLKKTDGSVIEVPLLSLSVEDRQHIKQQFPGAEEAPIRPDAEYRQWKSKSGKFSVLAEFLGCAEGMTQLRKPDGTEISVDRKQLSAEDQRWIAEELRRQGQDEQEAKSSDSEITGKLAAQEIAMKPVRLDMPRGKAKKAKASLPTDYLLRLTQPQTMFMSQGQNAVARDEAFHRAVQKEPRYSSAAPFRGVAQLGGKTYGFALDAAGAQAAAYNRLYFDLNGNGDLTDDKAVPAAETSPLGPGTVRSHFPRVDLQLEVDGQPVDYSFLLSAVTNADRQSSYTTVSLYAGMVREGVLTEGSKRTRLLLIDHNSNGRFDDTIALRGNAGVGEGDLLLVNPNPKDKLSADATMGRDRNFVSKLLCLGKEFYKMELPPSGDTIRLTPAKITLGSVTNGSPVYRAALVSDEYGGVLIAGMRDQKLPLPEGTWKLVNYSIDVGTAASAGRTTVAASFPQPVALTVSKDEAASLPFGAPYRAVVTARPAAAGQVYLSLAIVGSGGEQCTNLYVNGNRPPKPQFTIKDRNGSVAHQGTFEWG